MCRLMQMQAVCQNGAWLNTEFALVGRQCWSSFWWLTRRNDSQHQPKVWHSDTRANLLSTKKNNVKIMADDVRRYVVWQCRLYRLHVGTRHTDIQPTNKIKSKWQDTDSWRQPKYGMACRPTQTMLATLIHELMCQLTKITWK